MQLPRSLNVLGSKYKIVYRKKVLDVDGREVAGLCDRIEKTITISTALSKNEQLHTLYHELGHALCYRVSLYQTHGWSSDVEEILCDCLASCLLENFSLVTKKKKRSR